MSFNRRHVKPPARSATFASTLAAASRDRARASWTIRRASHTSTSPSWTRRHSSGNRCRRSSPSPISDFAAPSVVARTAPSSAGANSATSGVPSPPSRTSRSRPFPTAPGRASTACRSAHCIASHSCLACTRRSACFVPAASARIPAASSPSRRSASSACSNSAKASAPAESRSGSTPYPSPSTPSSNSSRPDQSSRSSTSMTSSSVGGTGGTKSAHTSASSDGSIISNMCSSLPNPSDRFNPESRYPQGEYTRYSTPGVPSRNVG